jgi:hypothetical protein
LCAWATRRRGQRACREISPWCTNVRALEVYALQPAPRDMPMSTALSSICPDPDKAPRRRLGAGGDFEYGTLLTAAIVGGLGWCAGAVVAWRLASARPAASRADIVGGMFANLAPDEPPGKRS